mgnify:CR=1 FL=1
MITEERVLDFIRSFGVDRGSEALHMIEKEAIRDDVPIIRKESGELLRILLQIKKPEKILEVGAAIGFSSVFMGENTDNNTHITTIENYPPRIERAKVNIALAGMEDKITLIAGDAAEVLKGLSGSWDFIFMDAAKGQYPIFLPEIKRLMHAGSVLVTDNVLQDGDLIESHYAIERRNRTIHKRMREYLYSLTHDEDFVCSILPVGDGLALCTMK